MKIKKLATWNVNGLRSVSTKGFFEWVTKESPDVICLQETKIDASVEFSLEGYELHFAYAQKKGYSGVATFIKNGIQNKSVNELSIEKFDNEGRTIISEFENFILINSYYPNGQRDHGRVPYKLEYSETVMQKAIALSKKTNKQVILTGDFNTSHTEIDLANPKSNINSTGFLPIERQWLDRLIQHDFIDGFRYFFQDKKNEYTWWTYRSNCREKNIGWRLDYFFVQRPLIENIKTIIHQQVVTGSDHCPVILEFK